MMIGHEVQRQWFMRICAQGTLRHAYIFEGDAHIGKGLFARALAHYLEYGVFEASSAPLLDCMECVPDEKGNIGIDTIRSIKKFIWQTPLRAPRRIVICDDAHALTREAEVSLLKITEEPPAHGLFLFITHDAMTLTPTLRSRCMKIYFARSSCAEIEKLLIEAYAMMSAHAKNIAMRASGSVGYAVMCATQKERKEALSLTEEIMNRILELRAENVMAHVSSIAKLLDRLRVAT